MTHTMTRFTCPETKYGHYGMASYRIELDISEPSRPLQRHIWTRDSGEIETQDWIPTFRVDASKLLARGWKPIK